MKRERFEIKYLFPLDSLDELIAFISPFMRVDRYSKPGSKIGSYKVRSLYFDSSDFDFYRTHVEGHQVRRKIRIRKYSSLRGSDYFLEIKNKVLFSIDKHRIKISPALLKESRRCRDFENLCSLFFGENSANWISEAVHFDILTLKIRPTVFISYNRLAYNSKFEHGVRLTIDFNIGSSKAVDFLRFKHEHAPIRVLQGHLGVLELKSDRTMPRWLRDVILHFGLTRVAFSKYKQSIEQIYGV